MITKLFEQINEINSSNEYWLVRTDGGQYFDTFYKNGFIGINWNYITLEDLKGDIEVVKAKIARNESLNLEDPSQRSKATMIYNKLLRFINLKKGDRVIIPSSNSDQYAFGIVSESKTLIDPDKGFECDHYKRRKIKWVILSPMAKLDPIFYKIRMSRHSISSIREYSSYIDKQMDALFFKNGSGHFVINVKTNKEINLKSITILVNEVEKLNKKINNYFELGEDLSESFIN